MSDFTMTTIKTLVAPIFTKKNAEVEALLKTPDVPLTDKQKAIKDLMNLHGHHMGCQESTVRNMLEILTDAPKDAFKKAEVDTKLVFLPGTIVVPVGNPNSHNYALGEPVMMYESKRAMRSTGSIGNYLPVDPQYSGSMRLATAAEIASFIEKLELPALPRLLKIIEADASFIPRDEKEDA